MHIGYIPEDRVLGLSKLARIGDWALRDLPLQEDIAPLIVSTIDSHLNPKGTGVVIEGEHFCTRIRGVRSTQAVTLTDCFSGLMLDDPRSRAEFLSLITKGGYR